MIGFNEAVERVKAVARPLGAEEIALEAAAGRVLAGSVVAALASPPLDASSMDGYAVREADLAALPVRLQVVGEALPGRSSGGTIAPGTCMRIFTGGKLPEGAQRVVMQELVRREGEFALIDSAPGADRFVRPAGSDFRRGEVLLHADERLGPRQLVTAAAADVAQLSVYRLPRLFILATGDELAAPGTARERAGAIPDSLTVGVAALARHWGGDVIDAVRLGDDLPALEAAGAEGLARADVVVVTGGASVGERDFAKRLFGDRLELIFSKVGIKPGKPAWLGRVAERLVVGLPGNPTSAMVTARLFLAPLLAGMSGGHADSGLDWRHLPLAKGIGETGDRETFARARVDDGAAYPLSNQNSGAQRALAEADLLVRLAAGTPALPAGAMVPVLDF